MNNKERARNVFGLGLIAAASFTPGCSIFGKELRNPIVDSKASVLTIPTATTEQQIDRAVSIAVAKTLGTPVPVSAPITKEVSIGTTKEPAKPAEIAPVKSTAKVTETVVVTDTTTALTSKGSITTALRSGDGWILQHPDGDKTEIRTLPAGFTPDQALRFATDIKSLEIGSDLNAYSDWETALNTKRAGGALAGYNYDYNDFCPTADFKCNVQGDMYGWRTFQGEMVVVPGIGKLEGGPRRSVVLNVLNLDASVYAWDNDKNGQVTVKRGFTATGRIFDGDKNVDALERNLSGHWLFRQFNGTPEKSYIGVTDSPDNAMETLLVSVQRKQWGNNADGSKRMEFQLIRAELVKSTR